MIAPPEDVGARRAAYVAQLRARSRGARNCGFVACLFGVLMLVTGREMAGAPAVLAWAGLAVAGIGMGLLVFSLADRLAFLRTHPFEENG